MPFWMLEGISLELRGVTPPGNLKTINHKEENYRAITGESAKSNHGFGSI